MWRSFRSSVILDLIESDVLFTLLVGVDIIELSQYSTNTDNYINMYETNVCLCPKVNIILPATN